MNIKVEVGTLVTHLTIGSIVLNVTGSTHELVDLSGDNSGDPVTIRRKDNQQKEIKSAALSDFKQSDGSTALLTETGINGFNELKGILFDDNALDASDIEDFTSAVQAVAGSGGGTFPSSGDAGTPADSTVSPITGKTFGDIQGKGVAEAIMEAWFPSVVPNQVAPILGFTSGLTTAVLAGSDVSMNLEWAFTANDSQGKTPDPYVLTAAPGVGAPTVLNPADTDTIATLNLTDVTSNYVISLEGDYLEGVVPQDNYGNDQPGSRLPAGTAQTSFTLIPFWKTHHGLVATNTVLETDSALLRTQLNNLSGEQQGAMTSFSNLTIGAGQDYLICIPGTYTSVNAVRAGFPVNIASVEGQITPDNYAGSGTNTYTVIRIEGRAADSVIDTLTIS
ncbi:hypothetical protein [Vibrio phage vB_VmeM-Yong XC32]|nr:hypothetical protein [Vibrio phage vB_VmeM-Yong XC31]QAX96570.1 hypothetical protein [Vibrio phage vB_VmeM-Yong XC32]QAX96888.1 hypothetical protein [Vibrio phage vB_VmeM-Yong MS31]QAX97193.1 hypothetical protein [Vibrio phage vB_VmeM-Yong MS32]